jgi:hypothetical protein
VKLNDLYKRAMELLLSFYILCIVPAQEQTRELVPRPHENVLERDKTERTHKKLLTRKPNTHRHKTVNLKLAARQH